MRHRSRGYRPSQGEAEQVVAFVDAFVLPRYRDGLRKRPLELYETFCHWMIERLDPKFAVVVPRSCRDDEILDAVRRTTKNTRAFYLGSWGGCEIGEHPIEDAFRMVELTGGGAAVVVLGSLAYYASETPHPDRVLLVRDDKLRVALKKILTGIK